MRVSLWTVLQSEGQSATLRSPASHRVLRGPPVPQTSSGAESRVPRPIAVKRPMSSPAGPGQTVHMGDTRSTSEGPKTLLKPDDNGRSRCDLAPMPAPALSIDASAVDPIAALK